MDLLEGMSDEERQEVADLYGAATPETAALWVDLKDGLLSLKDVPPCQLSAERLRGAILSQGIQHENRRRAPWGWITSLGFASVACLGAAIVITLNSWAPSDRAGEDVAMAVPGPAPVASAQPAAPRLTAPAAAAKAAPAAPKLDEGDPDLRPERLYASITPRMMGTAARTEPDAVLVEAVPAPAAMAAETPAAESTGSFGAAAAVPSPVVSEAARTASAPPADAVVVVSQTDGGGAQATEVEKSGHVVFGG